jgi:hypothetical protein
VDGTVRSHAKLNRFMGGRGSLVSRSMEPSDRELDTVIMMGRRHWQEVKSVPNKRLVSSPLMMITEGNVIWRVDGVT